MKNQPTDRNTNYTQELRSNKANNIIGPVPSKLIRYGITVICLSLICVITVSSFLPYRKVISGVVYISDNILLENDDSIHVNAELKFNLGSNVEDIGDCRIVCDRFGYQASGIVISHIAIRPHYGDAKVNIRFKKNKDFENFKDMEADFRIIVSEVSVFNQLLNTIKVKKD